MESLEILWYLNTPSRDLPVKRSVTGPGSCLVLPSRHVGPADARAGRCVVVVTAAVSSRLILGAWSSYVT